MSETECPTCGRDGFKSVQGMKQHHSRTHGESISGEVVSCNECGKEYRVKPCNADDRHLCSNECIAEWMKNINTEEHWNYNGGKVSLDCDECGEEYKLRPSKAKQSKYCSIKCANLAKSKITGEEHPLYKRKVSYCEECGEQYEVQNYRSEKSRFCSTGCRNDWLSSVTGEDHPLYEGGQHNKYKQRDWRIFSKKYRDWVGECENCGSNENLQTHHNEPISMGGHIYDNTFKVLCTKCHYGDFYKWHPPQLEEYIDRND